MKGRASPKSVALHGCQGVHSAIANSPCYYSVMNSQTGVVQNLLVHVAVIARVLHQSLSRVGLALRDWSSVSEQEILPPIIVFPTHQIVIGCTLLTDAQLHPSGHS